MEPADSTSLDGGRSLPERTRGQDPINDRFVGFSIHGRFGINREDEPLLDRIPSCAGRLRTGCTDLWLQERAIRERSGRALLTCAGPACPPAHGDSPSAIMGVSHWPRSMGGGSHGMTRRASDRRVDVSDEQEVRDGGTEAPRVGDRRALVGPGHAGPCRSLLARCLRCDELDGLGPGRGPRDRLDERRAAGR